MKIETQFSPGDRVWALKRGIAHTEVPCSFCAKTGQISSADGNTVRPCPECYGRGGKTEELPEMWRVIGPYTIGRVGVEITASPGVPGSVFDNYKAQEKREEEYMLVETGVGSGSVYKVDNLYADKDTARAEADARNEAPSGVTV